jgi:hypothetical protein
MSDVVLMFLNSLFMGFRSRAALLAEIIALRHQLTVLHRTQKPNRLILNRIDRCLWVWLSRIWSGWRSSLIIVNPPNRHRLASPRLPLVLDMEDSSWSTGTSSGSERNPGSDPQDEP